MKRDRIDNKLSELGFRKIKDDSFGIEYRRYQDKYKFTQVVAIIRKLHTPNIIQSYDKELFDSKNIGNTCVGLNEAEMKLFYKKLKKFNKKYEIKEDEKE